MSTPPREWVLLAYRLPREPSTPRITLWRKLRRLGVHQVGDGLVALPRDSRTQEQIEWLAEEVLEAGGEASTWVATALSRAEERAMAAQMTAAVAEEYRAVAEEARRVGGDPRARRRALARLRRQLLRIRRRDYFPPPEREVAEAAVAELARALEIAA